MTTKQKSLLLSTLLLVLCLALVAGGTYALFSDKVVLTNHLEAGTMDITLKRVNLITNELDPTTGYLKEGGTDETVDFSTPTDRNIFDLAEGALLVPTSSYTAVMEITNDAATSDVAFGYWFEIKFYDTTSAEFADQLTVTVTTNYGVEGEEVEHTVKLTDGQTFIGSDSELVGTLDLTAANKTETFAVSVTFEDLENNNDVKGKKVSFDLVVHAIQVVKAPAASTTP